MIGTTADAATLSLVVSDGVAVTAPPLPGRFVTLEGGEGAGKSTQLRRLGARLQALGHEVVLTREPGGSPGAEAIRTLVVTGEPGRWDALTETLLFYAARADHLRRTVRPALERGAWVLCDRFADSTMAYQGAGGGVEPARIAALHRLVLGDFRPDLTLLLDMDPAIGLTRALARAGEGGAAVAAERRFEEQDIDFHLRLRQAFLDIAAAEPARVVIIPADDGEAPVAEALWQALLHRFPDLTESAA